MLVLPAIDLHAGRCVRLRQGRFEEETVFSDDPGEVARRWEGEGASWIHVVDLDAAAGRGHNRAVLRQILEAVGVPVQFGGGARSLAVVEELLEMGVSRVVAGTQALRSPQFLREACRRFPEKVAVSIDAVGGRVAVAGWQEVTDLEAVALARRLREEGVALLIYTDVKRDGMMAGPNLEATLQVAREGALPVMVAGGVSSLAHVQQIRLLEGEGIVGAIIGRALYEGALTLRDALRAAGAVA